MATDKISHFKKSVILLNPSSSIKRTGLFSLDLYFLLVGNLSAAVLLETLMEKLSRSQDKVSRESSNIVMRIMVFIKY